MRDYKNYRAQDQEKDRICTKFAIFGALVGLLALLGWMGERDHQYKLEQVYQAAQCS